jgi:hypothetical protein
MVVEKKQPSPGEIKHEQIVRPRTPKRVEHNRKALTPHANDPTLLRHSSISTPVSDVAVTATRQRQALTKCVDDRASPVVNAETRVRPAFPFISDSFPECLRRILDSLRVKGSPHQSLCYRSLLLLAEQSKAPPIAPGPGTTHHA